MRRRVDAALARLGPVLRAGLRSLRGLRRTVPSVLSALVALLAALALDLAPHDGDVGALLHEDLVADPVVTLLGASVLWAFLLALWALLGRWWAALTVLAVGVTALALANQVKLEMRLEPVLPSDVVYLGQLGFLLEMVGTSTVVLVGLGIGAALVVGGLLAHAARGRLGRRPVVPSEPEPQPGPRWRRPVARLTVLALAGSFLGYAATFNSPGNALREAYDAAGARWAYWNQSANYARNGFVGGVLYNLDVAPMARPPGYSAATMQQVVRRYRALAERTNRERTSGVLDDANVVLVLSESFTDPKALEGIRLDSDPIPYTREVMQETTSGTMLAQLVGGGTANMEFEALTGLSMSQFAPQLASPYQMLVPDYERFPSVVSLLEETGHASVAVHPFSTQMYRRSTVYPILGFDDFVSAGELQVERTVGDSERISDASAFAEVQHQIERSSAPLLVNLVTMQNHYPMRGLYDDPVEVKGVGGKAAENAGGYLRGLGHSDAALRDFLRGLERSQERTAVVFYGDHHPPFWPERVRERTGELGMHSTPWFTWANFPMERLETAELTSPIHFLPMLWEAADAPVPPLYALLDRLRSHVPAMEAGRYLEPGSGLVPPADLDEQARTVLRDYRLVQYDLAVGERYSLEAMLDLPVSWGDRRVVQATP